MIPVKHLLLLPVLVLASCHSDDSETGKKELNRDFEKTPIQVVRDDFQPTQSSQKRSISKRIPTARWDSRAPRHIINPFSGESIPVIGAIGGDKITDSAGNAFFVPDFKDSPVEIRPVGKPVPGNKNLAISPYTKNPVDIQGIPPGCLVRDPSDPNPDHVFHAPKR